MRPGLYRLWTETKAGPAWSDTAQHGIEAHTGQIEGSVMLSSLQIRVCDLAALFPQDALIKNAVVDEAPSEAVEDLASPG